MFKLLDVFENAIKDGEELQTPISGGEGFVSRGFTGPWSFRQLYGVNLKASPPDEVTWMFALDKPTQANHLWTQYLFSNYLTAKKFSNFANKADEKQHDYGPQQQFVFQVPTVNLLGIKEMENMVRGWGDKVTFQGISAGFKSQRFCEAQLIIIPAIVHAFAKTNGLAVPDMAWDDLLDSDFLLTDELEVELVGSPDAKDASDPRHWTHSVYGKQRETLWAALGEPNVMAYQMIGTASLKGKPSRFATTSEKLSSLLRMAAITWTSPVWAQIIQVPVPTMKNKKAKIPLVKTVFANKADAEVAVAAMAASDNTETPVSATTGATGYPPTCGISQEEWDAVVADLVVGGMTAGDVAKELGSCTVSDVIKTKARLGL